MNKEIVFILSSLNDPHFQKRVKEFIKHGYSVSVYGFLREGRGAPTLPYAYHVLGTIKERNYLSRLSLYIQSLLFVRNQTNSPLFYYSSLDIALFARLFIKSNYIYEVCDLTELIISNPIIRSFLIRANKRCIRKSLLTVLTSQGFADFFADINPGKYEIIPNRVSSDCPLVSVDRKPIKGIIKIGFVGVIRFETTFNFVSACAGRKDVEMHLYGIYSDADPWCPRIKQLVESFGNIYYHGRFSNPVDLPFIYQGIDLLLCAYTPSPGVKYAEPNKLYESLFFNCPIIVSQGTFLGDKVNSLGIGYAIDSMKKESVELFLNAFSRDDYAERIRNCESFPKEDCIDKYDGFFSRIAIE